MNGINAKASGMGPMAWLDSLRQFSRAARQWLSAPLAARASTAPASGAARKPAAPLRGWLASLFGRELRSARAPESCVAEACAALSVAGTSAAELRRKFDRLDAELKGKMVGLANWQASVSRAWKEQPALLAAIWSARERDQAAAPLRASIATFLARRMQAAQHTLVGFFAIQPASLAHAEVAQLGEWEQALADCLHLSKPGAADALQQRLQSRLAGLDEKVLERLARQTHNLPRLGATVHALRLQQAEHHLRYAWREGWQVDVAQRQWLALQCPGASPQQEAEALARARKRWGLQDALREIGFI